MHDSPVLANVCKRTSRPGIVSGCVSKAHLARCRFKYLNIYRAVVCVVCPTVAYLGVGCWISHGGLRGGDPPLETSRSRLIYRDY